MEFYVIFVSIMMMSRTVDSENVEDESFDLPVLEKGVQDIGDLWDCRKSVPLNFNLFDNLTKSHLRSTVIGEKKTMLHYLKSTNDKMNIIKVDAEAKLELLGGLIKVGGSLNFGMESSNDDAFEKQTFRYDLKSHTIQLRSQAKERINEHVKDQLMRGEIQATHVVSKIWVGAYIDASITYTHKFSSNSMKIVGKSVVRDNLIKLIPYFYLNRKFIRWIQQGSKKCLW